MLAMNTFALERARQNHAHMERRGEQNHPTPRYGEDVKWLLKIALKLGKRTRHGPIEHCLTDARLLRRKC